MNAPVVNVTGIKPARDQAHRLTDLYACRELVQDALRRRGCKDIPAVWAQVLETAMENLSGWMVGLAGLQAPKAKRPNKSGVTGVDLHKGRYRARVWHKGRIVFCQTFDSVDAAGRARMKYLHQKQVGQ